MEKFFISADIEGVCGIAEWSEGDLSNALGAPFRKQMSREVAAACEAVHKTGVKEVLVKDAHGSGRSIDPSLLPRDTKIMRSWPYNPYSMMSGLDASFGGAGFIGYHSGAGSNGNPMAHTMSSKNIFKIIINGIEASEFLLNTYTASSFGVPVYFLSGDRQLCESANKIAPNIKTAAITEGIGAGSISIHPDLALEKISRMVASALEADPQKMLVPLPDDFDVTVVHRSHDRAYRASFYPGTKQTGAHEVKNRFKNWMDVITFIYFTI